MGYGGGEGGAGTQHPPVDRPRAARPEEIPAIIALCDAAFRGPPYTTSMGEDFPRLFSAANAADLRVIAGPDGDILAHAGLLRGRVLLDGIQVPAAAMGAVATRADVRGRGLGTAVVQDAMRRLATDGVAILTISGDRSLYLRAGAAPAGCCWRWHLAPSGGDPALRLRPPADLHELASLHAKEPVRWLRDLGAFAAHGYARSIHCRQSAWVVEAGSRAVAYWVVGVPDRGRRPRDTGYVIEFAGERDALAVTMNALCRQLGVRALTLFTAERDWVAGVRPELRPLPGTVAVLRPDVLAMAAGWPLPTGPDLVAAFFGRAGQLRDPALPPPLHLPWPNGLDYV